MVPYPAKGTPISNQITEKIKTARSDKPLKMNPENDMRLMGLFEFAKMPLKENFINS